jgi:hypothetical protein
MRPLTFGVEEEFLLLAADVISGTTSEACRSSRAARSSASSAAATAPGTSGIPRKPTGRSAIFSPYSPSGRRG